MRKIGLVILVLVVAVAFVMGASNSFAAKKEKFGVDKRHEAWKDKKWTTSDQEFTWRFTDTWGGLLFHDISIHLADSIRACSGGRLNLKIFPTGALVPAMEVFDATSKGTVDCFHSWPGYWKGFNEAFVPLSSVPFGLDAEGYNIWHHERGGQELAHELYGRYGMIAFNAGNVGQEMGLFSNKRATKQADYKGMRVRTPGWYMDILTELGASVIPVPGSEIYLALERGVIDACEYSCPAVTLPMGFHEITKYVIEPGAHQPSCQFDFVINKKKYDALPDDLKAIVQVSSRETDTWALAFMENLNIKAVEEIGKKVEYIKMDEEALNGFAKASYNYISDLMKKDKDVKNFMSSQRLFKEEFAKWRELRGGLAPWPYEMYVQGKHYQ